VIEITHTATLIRFFPPRCKKRSALGYDQQMKSSLATRGESVPENVGRYRVGKQLGVGGMGTIFEAYDALARRQVAYKRLKVANESARTRLTALFEREYNALRQLKHPNIVEVYDYGLDNEGPFYTMELLAGNDLAGAAPLAFKEACRIVRDVASALALLHARRLVHRDVTPANVRLTEDGRAKLIDFGALSEFGVAQEIVGTPAFVAPECLAGQPLDARTDLFSLGGLAYWALTRRHAYPARSMGELMDAWDIPVAPPSQYAEELPRALDQLVLALLERDPVVRPASAAHVIEQLTAIAALAPQAHERNVAHSYLLHPPLVGREATLEALEQLAAAAAAGNGQSAMIEAAPGLGRSALLDRIAVDAQLAGANVLRFQPSGKQDGGLSALFVRWLRALFPTLWSELRAKHPALSAETRAPVSAVASPGDVTMQRARLVSAIQACVEAVSEHVPLTLLVDDVQRADAESLAVLASLARSCSNMPLLLVTTLQEGAQGSDANALADLRAMATALPLAALSEGELESLAETVFGKVPNTLRIARFLKAQSGGVPGQCMDLCRLLLDQEQIRYALGTFVLPFDPRGETGAVGALELTRLTNVSDEARALARLLSLHEGALSVHGAASALSLEQARLVAAAEELLARSLLLASEDAFGLASQSLRAAIAASLDPAERGLLHASLARAVLAHAEPSLENRFSACKHLLLAGQEDEAIELVWGLLRDTTIPNGSIAGITPVLEMLLAALRKRGHSDEQCWPVLWPLVIAGFWGELAAVNRHRDATLNALGTLTGAALARRLMPRVGKKLALVLGLGYGVLRFFMTPKRYRAPSYPLLMQRFFSAVTMSTATASAAFEPETALQIASLLDAFEAAKEGSPLHIAREFAVATAELGAGFTVQAAQRYRRLLTLLQDPKYTADIRDGFIDGSVHGCAQADVSSGAPDALRMADELNSRHPFFRPHVETIKMTFYGYRGEKERALEHRKQAEILALQGGLSWSAFTVLSYRNAYLAMTAQDSLAVREAAVELERLSAIAPKMLVFRDLCHAYLALSGGRPQEALTIYERCAALPHANLRPAYELFTGFQAQALAQLGRLDDAKRLCEAALAMRDALGAPPYALRGLRQELALIEAQRGEIALAKTMLARNAEEGALTESPLVIGSMHRDQARVALLERDAAAFDLHFDAMLAAFRSTRNPSLIQQCRKLLAEAARSGVVAAPNWEKHELAAPANTQDLASQVPDVTELVDTGS
jgi:tRNA A-37 threonylcarbamoyl transferase component Bud32